MEETKINGTIYYSYECPCCGASMNVSADQKKLTCEFCGKKLYAAQSRTTGETHLQSQSKRNASRIVITVFVMIFVVLPTVLVICRLAGSDRRKTISSTYSEKAVIKEVDPFEGFQVKVSGYAPFAKIDSMRRASSISKIEYKADKTTGLSNGDVVTITVKPLEGYKWTKETFTYTVSGLDTLVQEFSQISEEELAEIDSFCRGKLTDMWEQNVKAESDGDLVLKIEPYKNYLRILKDQDMNYFNQPNTIIMAYKVDFTVYGVSGTLYQYIGIPKAFISPEGKLKLAYDRFDSFNGYIWLNLEFGVDDYISVNGYKTVIEMEADMEDDAYTLLK